MKPRDQETPCSLSSLPACILFVLGICSSAAADSTTQSPQSEPAPALTWPVATRPETKPWTVWWWHGTAVTKVDITANLEELHRSGIGGVSIVCLLDVKDEHAAKLRYLSKEWVEAVAHAVHEAHRLGMDADLSPVAGWAFGGPRVTRDDACAVVDVQRMPLEQCRRNGMRIATFEQGAGKQPDRRDLSAVVAQSGLGVAVDLTAKVDEQGILHWNAPEGEWTLYIAIARVGSSRVRMATDDGAGWVVNHLSSDAVKRYFEPYSQMFSLIDRRDIPRAFNNDSWEIRLDWSREFPREFFKRRGYDLLAHLSAFIGESDADTVSRIAHDYRQTLSELMVGEFTQTFHGWAAGLGRKIIGQACDEPANDLDTFSIYDIPQADVGSKADWSIKNGKVTLDRGKLAASPAHILGKPWIASETLTCFGPVMDTPMTEVKDKLDADFLMGINHSMLHGIAYSPVADRWPGWLFYAGFHLGPMNPMWRQQGPQISDYITRCQSILQSGHPAEELLIYLPIHDLWSQRADKNGNKKSGPPGVVATKLKIVPTATELWHQGYDFSLVSDRLLESIRVENGQLTATGAATYRALVIADCRLLPETTLDRLVELASQGATVILAGEFPQDVPGLFILEKRRHRFQSVLKQIQEASHLAATPGVREVTWGKGRILLADSAYGALASAGLSPEPLFEQGLRSIRRWDNAGTTYFIVNPAGGKEVAAWVPVNASGASSVILDPMTGRTGLARQRPRASGGTEVFLQLEPHESCFLRILKTPVGGPAWTYLEAAGSPMPIKGPWNVRFIEGGEAIPHPETIATLCSWTDWSGDQSAALREFSGRACYTARFTAPSAAADDWAIDLGEVLHTAHVRLNGAFLGDLFAPPLRVRTGSHLKLGENVLEIEVANTPMNRAAALDIQGIQWQKTLGENTRDYVIGDLGKFWIKKEAATWVPRPSGLLGPVQLIPLKKVTP